MVNREELDDQIRLGTRAVLAAQVISQLVAIAVLAILYRQIEKAAYGLLGMAFPLVMLPRMLATLGLSVTAIQRKTLSDVESSALFWFNQLFGLLAGGLTIGLGFGFAVIYATPELSKVCLVLAGTSLVAALGAQHQALLERRLKFRQLAMLRIAAQLAGAAAAIVAAVNGWQVWSLVVQQYVELALLTIGVLLLEKWRPGRPPTWREARPLLAFGGYYSLSTLMFYLAQQADKIFLAWMLGATATGRELIGMYTQAFQLMMKPVYLVTSPITGIMLPALSRAAGNRKLFVELTGRFYRIVIVGLAPAGLGLALVGQDLMLTLGGASWATAGWFLVALAPIAMVQGCINIAGSVLTAAGRPDRLFFGSIIVFVVLLQAAIGGYWLGHFAGETDREAALGMAVSLSAATLIVLLIPYLLFCFASVGIRGRELAIPLRRMIVSLALMALVVVALHRLLVMFDVPAGGRLVTEVVVGAGVYCLLARDQLRWVVSVLRT